MRSRAVSDREFAEILSVLSAGGVIGFPTDTAYGLGADPFNAQAVARIFEIKGRVETKPILLLVDSLAMTERVAYPSSVFEKTAARFWPGPLTIVLKAKPDLPTSVSAGTGTIGVRWPVASFAKALMERYEQPITATSANRSGSPSCVTAGEVQDQLGDSLALLIDGGDLPARGGSTLLDLTDSQPALLREGPVTFEVLREFFNGNIRRADA